MINQLLQDCPCNSDVSATYIAQRTAVSELCIILIAAAKLR